MNVSRLPGYYTAKPMLSAWRLQLSYKANEAVFISIFGVLPFYWLMPRATEFSDRATIIYQRHVSTGY